MPSRSHLGRLAATAVLAGALAPLVSGCALFRGNGLLAFNHRPREIMTVRPGPIEARPGASPEDIDYQAAAYAIRRRDYALALDLLQSARELKADDVRVLNAFGVVYDKLGRFDLSGRYYAQATALDPTSPILANNIAWSRTLQSGSVALAMAAPAGPPAARPVRTASRAPPANGVERVAPGVIRLVLNAPPRAPDMVQITGHPLIMVDASGRADAERVRVRLARLGWSAPAVAHNAPARPHTEIRFPAPDAAAARALARTLPGPVELAACDRTCAGVELWIGADSASWAWAQPGGRD
ncbi:MAG TPA: LytR C-terminal domain-containing protein [Caulobacteraceae bacterium]|nr:LytR C-terminal domain-containing protein [Caulobacteraceae bacterium]